MALFGKVGGGIYTKAADVGADLVGKVERNIHEDDPHLHGLVFIIIFSLLKCVYVIADNVGDNVGDIAGMGSDLFGSYAESSCAALVLASISSFGTSNDFIALLISSMGIIVFLITNLFATDIFEIKVVKEIEPTLKKHLIISTVLMTIDIAVVSLVALPPSFTIFNFGEQKVVKNWYGILSVCYHLAAMYGIAVAALGMLSTIATGLAIDAYGPINNNAAGIAEMAGMSHRNAWYLLPYLANGSSGIDPAGNTTAAIGKGFAIGSAALVSLALFEAFVSHVEISTVDVLTPKVFIGLILRAMLPYRFSTMTMKSLGSAALKMVEEVRRHINTIPSLMEGTAKLDYATCVKISTDASLKELIPPGCLVMLTPLIVAISASNIGGAWDNANKYIEVDELPNG
ncbi:hypothetical protein KI387_043712 [Taxus chinensis]|uniref:H(+)-exporting diphosphatase n=1 Tax=Taxus chinensis TaxID=29808 RepID=A0AA38H027_TAXCH|nr:hypothetical protein KI387_043712 [Taxus chinensis]